MGGAPAARSLMMVTMTDDEHGDPPQDEPDAIEIELPGRGPRPWEFDLDNLPDEFTVEILGRLTLDELEQLREADLDPKQRQSFEDAEAQLLKPLSDAGQKVAESLRLNSDVANRMFAELNLSSHFKPIEISDAVTLPKIDLAQLPKIKPFQIDAPKIDVEIPYQRVTIPDWWKDQQSTIDHLQIVASQPSRLPDRPVIRELAVEEGKRLAEEQERVDRERQSLMLMGEFVQAQKAMLDLQTDQAEASKTDRKLEWAVLGVAILTVLATVAGIIVTIALNT